MGRNKTFTKKGSRLQESFLNQDLLNISAQDQMLIVSDQNSVSAESIGRNHWYRYRFRSRHFFSETETFFFFFSKFFKKFLNFSMYFCLLGEYKFLKT